MGPPTTTKYYHETALVISKNAKTDNIFKNITWMAIWVGVTLTFTLMIVIIFRIKRRHINSRKAMREMIELKR